LGGAVVSAPPGGWIVSRDGDYGYEVNEVAAFTRATVSPVPRPGRYTPRRINKADVVFVGSEADCRLACERMVSSRSLAASERAKAEERHRARVAKISNMGPDE
jgi:hypothetical protein